MAVVRRLLKAVRLKLLKLTTSVGLIKPGTTRPSICAPTTSALQQTSDLHSTTHVSENHDHGDRDRQVLTLPAASTEPEAQGTSVVVSAANNEETEHTPNRSLQQDKKPNRERRPWESIQAEILQDIQPLVQIAKSILHSRRYRDGERLSAKDEKAVVEKLLQYHYGYQKKIGSGFRYIKVDRNEEFEDYTRCMFVVRTDGSCIDFSYKKCLRGYVEQKYPSYAAQFVKRNRHLVK